MGPFCEVCFRRPKATESLLLSSCRHMFCRQCGTSLGQCCVCKVPCRTVEIRPDALPGDLKDYFVPAERLLTKALKVAQFQRDKLDTYIAGQLEIKLQKYETKKKNIEKLKQHYESLNSAVKEEQALIRKLREQRKSPSMLAVSPNSPMLPRGQVSSLRMSAHVRAASPTVPMSQSSGSHHSGSRWTPLMSQASNASQSSSVGRASGGGIPARRPSVSPIATFKKPADLVSTAKAGIYEQQVRNIDRAMKRSRESVVRANRRSNDIERARNGRF